MYGKLFEQMYNGTLGTRGPWQALVTFQQMIILADKDGVVDMTAEVISKRSTIPLDIILHGLECLQQPDSESRTPDEDGKRISLLDNERSWGWRIVNYAKYRKIRSEEERREYMRNYQRERRASSKQSSTDVNMSTPGKQCQPIAVSSKQEAVSITTLSGKPDVVVLKASKPDFKTEAREILEFLNSKTGRNYQPGDVNLSLVAARLKEGASVVQCRQIIAKKSREWLGDEKMEEFLRPATLFNKTKFAQYLGELV